WGLDDHGNGSANVHHTGARKWNLRRLHWFELRLVVQHLRTCVSDDGPQGVHMRSGHRIAGRQTNVLDQSGQWTSRIHRSSRLAAVQRVSAADTEYRRDR